LENTTHADTVTLVDDGPRNCSVARTLEVVGDRWSLLVIREAFLGAHRFDQMQRGTGAPRDILAARLRKLVETGVLERRRYQDRPPRFEYHLTQAGRDLHPVITALRQWGDRHVTEPEPRPVRFAHECGGHSPATLVCPDCGERVAVGSYRREEPAPAA
jgi:DNA-binding HxlR family transcriptional regulator